MPGPKIDSETRARIETFGLGAGMTEGQIDELINIAAGQGKLTIEQIMDLAKKVANRDMQPHEQAYLNGRPDATASPQPKRMELTKGPGFLRRS